MAVGTWYATNNLSSVYAQLSETDPGTETTSSPATGWIGGTGSTLRSEFRPQTERASSTFDATTYPDGSLDTTNGDGFRTALAYSGTFAAGNWVFHFTCRATTATGCSGKVHVRMFRSVNANGSGATEITSGDQAGTTVTSLATGTTQDSSVTFNPGSFTLGLSGTAEFLFFQIAWERTGGGGMTTSDINMRIGNSAGAGTRVTSPAFTAGYVLIAAQGAFTFTGEAATLTAQKKIIADNGSFTLTGEAAGLAAQRRIVASQGSFALTGQAAGLAAHRLLTANHGSFSLAGQAVNFAVAMAADTGLFVFTGNDAALIYTPLITLIAETGMFVLTGNDAGVSVQRLLTADAGLFAMTGQAVTLTTQRLLQAEAGLFSMAGSDIGLGVAMFIEGGTFDLSGQAADLRAVRALMADYGSVVLAGQDAWLYAARLLSADYGAFAVSGQDAQLTTGFGLFAEHGAFLLTGYDAQLVAPIRFLAECGIFTLDGAEVSLRCERHLLASTGMFILTGNDVLFVATEVSGIPSPFVRLPVPLDIRVSSRVPNDILVSLGVP